MGKKTPHHHHSFGVIIFFYKLFNNRKKNGHCPDAIILEISKRKLEMNAKGKQRQIGSGKDGGERGRTVRDQVLTLLRASSPCAAAVVGG